MAQSGCSLPSYRHSQRAFPRPLLVPERRTLERGLDSGEHDDAGADV